MDQVETRSYTAYCRFWRKLRVDEPLTYSEWVKQVIQGRVIVIPLVAA